MRVRLILRVCLALLGAVMLSTSAHAATVTLEWDRNPEPDVQGYIVRYGTQRGVYTIELNVGNQVAHTLNLNPSTTTTFYFVVQAYNAYGRSANSAEVSTTVQPSAASQSTLTVDKPVANAILPSDTLLSGWALDRAATSGTGVDAVHVYAYPNPGSGAAPIFLGVASYGSSRPDVGAAYGTRFTNSGFTLPVVGLANGTYDIRFYGRSTVTGTFNAVQTRRVTISPAPPITGGAAAIGLPAPNARVRTWLSIGGWALDVRSTNGPGTDVVQVWAYPNPGSGTAPLFLGNARFGIDRPDVANAFGNARYRYSGFYMDVMSMPAGVFDIVALARSTVTRSWEVARVTRITVDPAVLITIDAPAQGATVGSSFALTGWTLDRRAASNSGIDSLHVYAYPNPGSGAQPVWIGAFTPNQLRSDVAAAYGSQYQATGFRIPANLGPGVYDIVIFAHSSVSRSFDNGRLVRVTVQ
jgi:hypothetical protein